MEASPRFQDPELATPNTVVAGAQVHQLQPREGIDPKYQILAEKIQDLMAEKAAITNAMVRLERDKKALQREMDDLLEESADRNVVMGILTYWHGKAGKDAKTKLTMAGTRARHVRWMARRFTPREICVAIYGMLQTPYYHDRGLTDLRFVCTTHGKYDETKVEAFLTYGERVLLLDRVMRWVDAYRAAHDDAVPRLVHDDGVGEDEVVFADDEFRMAQKTSDMLAKLRRDLGR